MSSVRMVPPSPKSVDAMKRLEEKVTGTAVVQQAAANRLVSLQNSPRIAVVNQQFVSKIFGSVETETGGYYKMPDGNRIEVVGVAEDGTYGPLTEGPHAAVVLPILRWPNGNGVQARHFPPEGH
jgi:hypothetical protein